MKGVLQVRNLSRTFKMRERGLLFSSTKELYAVDNISFDVAPGEMLGVVGESGCGKSTTARLLLGHIPASCGQVTFSGETISAEHNHQWRLKRQHMQMIYQDPLSALDPRITVSVQIEEPLIVHRPELSSSDRKALVADVMNQVGLLSHHGMRFPHELSGGQRQRVIIARAISLDPELLVCDEPVSALDVAVQAQVLNVLEDSRARRGFTGIFISHDLKVVRQIAERVIVMYLGRIIEMGNSREVFSSPAHPYTKALVSAVPVSGAHKRRDRIILKGDPPSPVNIPPGCPFHTRCAFAMPGCSALRPELINVNGRAVACHLINNPSLSGIGTSA
ncbi:ATP-binding cassette domain-containing protein [Dickeya dianthicola]|uniref:ABC transporter ATP-binding protein n=1 Tax=Dickeya dianthicola TaxID=204039 RepID=UPI00063D2433|nr:oligopeptide/dipeptide ABC transporter ATP-binding protein [Dickeya dianthicola]MCI4186803.1 ATP-binding cassette domain-containing protein [Dickeya dianthicola]MZG44957.1 ATP-binding cassette domain-containing protein [Dickeya dianthicola]